jgi:glyceraldehyde 3-phosphate dehydrogenase
VQFSTDPIVSSDVIGNSHSSVFDSLATKVVGGDYLKTILWYDNEYGYACRVVDLLSRLDGES